MTSVNSQTRRPTVAFLGGHITGQHQINFAEELGRSAIKETGLRICVSDYKGKTTNEGSIFEPSFGFCVANAASKELTEADMQDRLLTCLVRKEADESRLFSLGQLLSPEGKSTKQRRLSIISQSDVVCLGAGDGPGIKEMYDFAKASKIPVLPLPFLGGRARTLWLDNCREFGSQFGLHDSIVHRWSSAQLDSLSTKTLQKLADDTVKALVSAVKRRCLIFMPFASHFRWVYDRIIEPAAGIASIELVRIDLQNYAGDIVSKFKEELEKSDCLLAVVTGENANVFYEIGFAHAIGRNILFLCQRGESSTQIQEAPFYIRNHRIIWYPSQFDAEGINKASHEIGTLLRKIH